jgi:asparagine synthase (glutamine-hydrolysing)
MFAIARRHEREPARQNSLANRLGSSLCAGIGGTAAKACIDGLHVAQRPLGSSATAGSRWTPTILQSGRMVLFNGYFDNIADIATALGTHERDPAQIYGLAVERWGEEAERRIIGNYCTVIADPRSGSMRLSRSPFQAPPLYYAHTDHLTAAASVPRALFAAGVERRLNEARLADAALRNFSDDEASAFEGVSQVPTGCLVELDAGRSRVLHRWYNLLDIPIRGRSDSEAVETAGDLLDEGVRACLAGFRRPGSTLSGGLDSPQVAVRALAALPRGGKLPTFTFHPEPGFDGRVPRWMMGDERPFVEALARMHPGLEPHFTANEGYEHDHRWNELFHLIGDPAVLPASYVYHGLLAEAVKAECDLLLVADFGNLTFSDRGECGFVEYLLTGRWVQLWLALTRPQIHAGSILRRFTARTLSALLPNTIWTPLRRLLLSRPLPSEIAQPLSAQYRHESGADKRLKRSGIIVDRYQPWTRRHSRKLLFANTDSGPFYQGLEQMYGVVIRDPTAYRPFVEFCLSLPTRMFLRDGEVRWLAKQLAKGIMPEEQRTNPLLGWWDADWHVRLGRRRSAIIDELDRMAADERMARMIDVPRLRAALEDWPEVTETDPAKFLPLQLALPAALLTNRFVNYVEGRNTP